jgi:hypothetical protein
MARRNGAMTKPGLDRAPAAGAPSGISADVRDFYVAYCSARARLSAWLQVNSAQGSERETELRRREVSSVDALMKAPARTLADLGLKLQVLTDQTLDDTLLPAQELFKILAEDSSRIAIPVEKIEGQIVALRTTLRVLLNAVAAEPRSFERARRAILDLIEAASGRSAASSHVDQAAKDEIGALFTWID